MIVATALVDISGITVMVRGRELLTSLPCQSIRYEDKNRTHTTGYGALISDINAVSGVIEWFQKLPEKYAGPFANEATRSIIGEAIISEYRRSFVEPLYELFSNEL